MKVLAKSVYRGPHLYSNTPMVRIELDLGALEDWPTQKISGFADRLLALLPGLQDHGCSYGQCGGFMRRMDEGTWLGHVAEHVALELQLMAGSTVSRGKTRTAEGRHGIYNVMFEYETPAAGLCAGRFALEIVNSLLPPDLAGLHGLEILHGDSAPEFSTVAEVIGRLKEINRKEALGPTTRAIVAAAEARGIPTLRLGDDSLVQLGWGKHRRLIQGSITDATPAISVDLAGNKAETKKRLAAAGIPVPEGSIVRSIEATLEEARIIGYPLVLKPLNGNQGKGVTTNVRDEAGLRRAYERAATFGSDIVVEKFFMGRDFRVLVINGKVEAVAERVPAHVVGDGKSAVAELIEALNQDPRRGVGHESVLTKIKVDQGVHDVLACANLSLESVPEKGAKVMLCCTANLSTGGTAIDRTDALHPDNKVLFERAARLIGLDIAGLDVVAEDISQPLADGGGAIIEVNASPGFRMHLAPAEGQPRKVGEAVVSMLFPQDQRGRIPIAAITGTNGKSTTARMVTHILRQGGHTVGFTSATGVQINDDVIWRGDASGPRSARMILQDGAVDYAVLETARGGILREGLAFDKCDVGAVLNVTADHLGIGGVNSIEDLADVKSVVVQTVTKNGLSVLNADDPQSRAMIGKARGRLCFFSMKGGYEMDEMLRQHINDGGMALVYENWMGQGQLALYEDARRTPLIRAGQIPATFDGFASFNVQNALAAAIAFGMGMDVPTVRAGLASFDSSYEQNPGRFNIYDGHPFRVIMDYAHNPAALAFLLSVVRHMRKDYGHVIGALGAPGDRDDNHLREMGRIAASEFDFLIFRELPERRGRPEGEIVRLLTEGALSAGFPKDNIIHIPSEEEATGIALQKAGPGDLVVLMPSDSDGCWQQVRSYVPETLPAYLSQSAWSRHV